MARLLHSLFHTIGAGASASTTPLDLRLVEPVSLIMPPAWTGAGSAAITFYGSPDGVHYGYLSGGNAQLLRLMPINISRQYILPTSWFKGINWLFIISGEGASRTNQSTTRTVCLNCRDREETETA